MIPLVVSPDALPAVRVTAPGRDLVYAGGNPRIAFEARATDDFGLRSLTLRYATANQAPEVTKVEVPDLAKSTLDSAKKLKFKWSATDANEDDLSYKVYVRKDGWANWVRLEDDLDKTDYEWDTTTTPSGIYQLKVVASDRKDNPEEEALTGERITGPFPVSHTPPAVSGRFEPK